MKIYILECGRYEDRYIVGIFSTREKALRVKEERNNRDDSNILEYEVDVYEDDEEIKRI